MSELTTTLRRIALEGRDWNLSEELALLHEHEHLEPELRRIEGLLRDSKSDDRMTVRSARAALDMAAERLAKEPANAEAPPLLLSVDDVVLAFLCPICAHDAVDEDQCCSSCGADSYVVAKADAEDLGRRLKSLAHLEDILAAWVSLPRAGNQSMTAELRALYDAGMEIVAKRKGQ